MPAPTAITTFSGTGTITTANTTDNLHTYTHTTLHLEFPERPHCDSGHLRIRLGIHDNNAILTGGYIDLGIDTALPTLHAQLTNLTTDHTDYTTTYHPGKAADPYEPAPTPELTPDTTTELTLRQLPADNTTGCTLSIGTNTTGGTIDLTAAQLATLIDLLRTTLDAPAILYSQVETEATTTVTANGDLP